MPLSPLAPVRRLRDWLVLPPEAKTEAKRDAKTNLGEDAGIDRCLTEAVRWLCRAQDSSASHDGGVARHYSLRTGWSASYPETTGYIVPTIFDAAADLRDETLRERAKRMVDWLVSIQLPEGGFQGGVIGQTPVVPVTFNTGQILMGLARGVTEFGEAYRPAMRAAADWLVATQDADGAWRRHASPFAMGREKAYDTHVAWGLFEAARVEPDAPYAESGARHVRWAISRQQANGWFADCCLNDPDRPLTHTIGYALRGVVEGYRLTQDPQFLGAALKTARGLLGVVGKDGHIPGRLTADWKPAVKWVCLTGSVQIAHSWLLLYKITGETRFRDAAFAANRYVRRTVRVDGPANTRGAVKGSFRVTGGYGQFEYLNWAAKFFVDSNRLEREVRALA